MLISVAQDPSQVEQFHLQAFPDAEHLIFPVSAEQVLPDVWLMRLQDPEWHPGRWTEIQQPVSRLYPAD